MKLLKILPVVYYLVTWNKYVAVCNEKGTPYIEVVYAQERFDTEKEADKYLDSYGVRVEVNRTFLYNPNSFTWNWRKFKATESLKTEIDWKAKYK